MTWMLDMASSVEPELDSSLTSLDWMTQISTANAHGSSTAEPEILHSPHVVEMELQPPSSTRSDEHHPPDPAMSPTWNKTADRQIETADRQIEIADRQIATPDYGSCLRKPGHSYSTLISQALSASVTGLLTLSDIYTWIMDNYPYYRQAGCSWKNSVRHNLSLNKTFKKVPRSRNDPGKGSYWALSAKMDKAHNSSMPYAKKKRKDLLEAEYLPPRINPVVVQAIAHPCRTVAATVSMSVMQDAVVAIPVVVPNVSIGTVSVDPHNQQSYGHFELPVTTSQQPLHLNAAPSTSIPPVPVEPQDGDRGIALPMSLNSRFLLSSFSGDLDASKIRAVLGNSFHNEELKQRLCSFLDRRTNASIDQQQQQPSLQPAGASSSDEPILPPLSGDPATQPTATTTTGTGALNSLSLSGSFKASMGLEPLFPELGASFNASSILANISIGGRSTLNASARSTTQRQINDSDLPPTFPRPVCESDDEFDNFDWNKIT